MIWVGSRKWWLWRKILNENISNLESQKNITYQFSTLDSVATEKEDVKSSLGSLGWLAWSIYGFYGLFFCNLVVLIKFQKLQNQVAKSDT